MFFDCAELSIPHVSEFQMYQYDLIYFINFETGGLEVC